VFALAQGLLSRLHKRDVWGTTGAQGGSGGCLSIGCGPDGAPCCSERMGCGSGGPTGSLACSCFAGRWSCRASFGGIGGEAGFGGTVGCQDSGCGPQGAPCCHEGTGCALSDSGYSCACFGGQWQCTLGTAGALARDRSKYSEPRSAAPASISLRIAGLPTSWTRKFSRAAARIMILRNRASDGAGRRQQRNRRHRETSR
jgi:hypothetical protein